MCDRIYSGVYVSVVNNNAGSYLLIFTSLSWFENDKVNHSNLILNNEKSPCKVDIYVGAPYFFLGSAVAPTFFYSRITTPKKYTQVIKSIHKKYKMN